MMKLCLTLFALALTLAGADPSVRSGTIEITGFGGVNANLPGTQGQLSQQLLGTNPAGGGTKQMHPVWGGAVGLATSHRILLLGEFMYGPLGSAQFSQGQLGVTETSTLYEFTGGVQYLFRTQDSRLAPYIGGAIGEIRQRSTVSLSAPAGLLAGPSSVSESQNKAAGNLSAGMRLHISDSFGIRPEFRVMRIPGKTYVRADSFSAFSRITPAKSIQKLNPP